MCKIMLYDVKAVSYLSEYLDCSERGRTYIQERTVIAYGCGVILLCDSWHVSQWVIHS